MGSFSLHPLPDGLPYACQAIAKHSAVVALILNVTIKIIDSNEIRNQVSGSFVVSIVKRPSHIYSHSRWDTSGRDMPPCGSSLSASVKSESGEEAELPKARILGETN